MLKSNPENIVSNINKVSENNYKTLLDTYSIFIEYHSEDTLYPNNELEKWKRKLNIMRSKNDGKLISNPSPLRRYVNDGPLNQVFQSIMNKDSFSILANENSEHSEYPKWQVNSHKLEAIIGPYTLDSLEKVSIDVHQNIPADKTSAKTQQIKSKNQVISADIDTNNYNKSSKPLNAMKKNQIDDKKENKNAKRLHSAKDSVTKINIAIIGKTTRSLKKKNYKVM